MQIVDTAFLMGSKPILAKVELVRHRGIPQLVIIGLATKAVVEAKERLKSAIKCLGVKIPHVRFVFNLIPADIAKQSTCLDLALAVCLLREVGMITTISRSQVWLGELGLDGSVRPVKGALAMAAKAVEAGATEIHCAAENYQEMQLLTGVEIFPITHLKDLLSDKAHSLSPGPIQPPENIQSRRLQWWRELSGMQLVKRALVISAAGWHHLLLTGPPGVGKTSLAQTLVDLLPAVELAEAREIGAIYSTTHTIVGAAISRPLRMPPSNSTIKKLFGSVSGQQFGEITLAHRGVLFLDELSEFSHQQVELLRQPLELGTYTLGETAETYPARFLLIAATNPCRCGYYGLPDRQCQCTPQVLHHYQQKLSGSWLDRLDLAIQVSGQNHRPISGVSEEREITTTLQSIKTAWAKQKNRWSVSQQLNGQVTSPAEVQSLALTTEAAELLAKAENQLKLSHRGKAKIIKVARTIMDLLSESNEVEPITSQAVAEALQYRPIPRFKNVS